MQLCVLKDAFSLNSTKEVLRQNQPGQKTLLNPSLNHLQGVDWIVDPALFWSRDLSGKWPDFWLLEEGLVISDRA
jgi:hypothetical protein